LLKIAQGLRSYFWRVISVPRSLLDTTIESQLTSSLFRSANNGASLEQATPPIKTVEWHARSLWSKLFKRDYARVSAKPNAASVLRQLSWFDNYNNVHPLAPWIISRRASSGNE
jgi:hypothetical protein